MVDLGSQEFYSHRAEITKRLIQEKGFTIIACEADWPPAYRVNRWVKGLSSAANIKDANDALKEFIRFPSWMWFVFFSSFIFLKIPHLFFT